MCQFPPKKTSIKLLQRQAEAFELWSKTPVPRRARVLFKYQQLLVEHWEELAQLITKENGKKLSPKHMVKCCAASSVWNLPQALHP